MPTTPRTHDLIKSSLRALNPFDRFSEVLCGLVAVLTFTGSISVAHAGPADVRTMLIGAFGCNLAWSIIDATLHLLGCLSEKVRDLKTLKAVRSTNDSKEAQRLIAGAVPSMIATVLHPAELEGIQARLKQLPGPPEHARLTKEDWLGALGVFFLTFFATFPVVIPFLFMHEAVFALRVSNGIAIGLLFMIGFAAGHSAGGRGWLFGIGMVVLGGILVAITMALGG